MKDEPLRNPWLRAGSVILALGVLTTLMVHAGASAGCARTNTAEPQVAPEPTTTASSPNAEPTTTPSDNASPTSGATGLHKCTPMYMGATKAGPVIPPGCESHSGPSNINQQEPTQKAP